MIVNKKGYENKKKLHSCVALKDIDEDIRNFILKQNPQLNETSELSFDKLLSYRLDYTKEVISSDSKKMEKLNEQIVETIKDNKTISSELNETLNDTLTFGQKAADILAKFGGSWLFICFFCLTLLLWIFLNTVPIFFQPFDKYPYILLNLALSCLAAIQAPIILMSQNREADRDRAQAVNDYKVNLKSEIEVALLHEKMDYLINNQWQHLVHMQHMQIELLGELQKQIQDNEKKNKKTKK